MGKDKISKRLDRVYASVDLLEDSTLYRSWVDQHYISDHAPVLFQIDFGVKSVSYPFKFNSVLLKDESFGDLVKDVWTLHRTSMGGSAQSRLVGKLKSLKERVRKWLVSKKKSDQQKYTQIEKDIAF
jgi:hypothetical protein